MLKEKQPKENSVEVASYTYIVRLKGPVDIVCKFSDFHKAYMKAIYLSIDYPDDEVELTRESHLSINMSVIDKSFKYKFKGGQYRK